MKGRFPHRESEPAPLLQVHLLRLWARLVATAERVRIEQGAISMPATLKEPHGPPSAVASTIQNDAAPQEPQPEEQPMEPSRHGRPTRPVPQRGEQEAGEERGDIAEQGSRPCDARATGYAAAAADQA